MFTNQPNKLNNFMKKKIASCKIWYDYGTSWEVGNENEICRCDD